MSWCLCSAIPQNRRAPRRFCQRLERRFVTGFARDRPKPVVNRRSTLVAASPLYVFAPLRLCVTSAPPDLIVTPKSASRHGRNRIPRGPSGEYHERQTYILSPDKSQTTLNHWVTKARSAGFQPAVAQIFNLRISPTANGLPNEIRRYGRLKTCATSLPSNQNRARKFVIYSG